MARRPQHVEPEEHEGGMERWLLTYADMITLLLALFVVLFALSTVNVQKFTALANALRNTFSGHATVVKNDTGLLQHNSLVDHVGAVTGLHPTQQTQQSQQSQQSQSAAAGSTTTTTTQPSGPPPPGSQSLAVIHQELNAALSSAGLMSNVAITQTAPTPTTSELVVQVLSDQVFYALDSADLGTVGDRVVDTIASVLRTDTNNAAVQGYTDNQAIYGGPYATNWELSAERAVHVVERLTSTDGLSPDRLQVVGFGQTRPAVPNTSPANQAINRRVDVVILAPGESQS
jgi:chemotaxis protein MotB